MDKFEKALALINGTKLATDSDSQSGNCIQHALVVCDFLQAVGFPAEPKSVAIYVEAYRGDTLLHSMGCGARQLLGHDPNPERTGWDGHLVVTSMGHLIDPTFYQFRRPAWEWTPDIALLHLIPRAERETFAFHGAAKERPVIAGFARTEDDYRFRALWMTTPANSEWVRMPAARLDRRDWIVAEMVEHWEATRHERHS
jgi:hypothetical protein